MLLPKQERIKRAVVVGADETGTRIGKEKGWFWTWQNEKLTFITASMNRGTQTINKHFGDGFPKAVLAHDCWKSHFELTVFTHQICIAHLLRELTHLVECYDSLQLVTLGYLLNIPPSMSPAK